ncbi:MAG: glycosyltransferase [Acidimicrobiales bacterium]
MSLGGDRGDLVVAASWPAAAPPYRLVEALAAAGRRVTVACEVGQVRRWPCGTAGAAIEVVALPRVNQLTPASVVGLATAGVRSGRRPAATLGLARRLTEAAGGESPGRRLRALGEGWFRLAPLAGRSFDRLLVAADPQATEFVALAQMVGPLTVVVDRPGPEAEHGGFADPGFERRRQAWSRVLGSADAVVATGPALLDRALALGAPPRPSRLMRPQVDLDGFHPEDDPGYGADRLSRPLVVAAPAPWHWTSGHDYLLVALARLLAAGMTLELRMPDADADRQRLLYTLFDLGLREVTRLESARDVGSRVAMLSGADVVVVPGVEDRPWPEVLEAMASGRALVTTELPSNREMVDGDQAVVVRPRDSDALAAAIGGLAEDPKRRQKLGVQARLRAQAWAAARSADNRSAGPGHSGGSG